MGFDDSLVCTLISPSLTTMRIQKKRIGELAVHRLHEIINGDKTAQVTLVNAELVVRGLRSTEKIIGNKNYPDTLCASGYSVAYSYFTA